MKLKISNASIDLASPKVMGILNVTPDSFSDGGVYFRIDDALQRVEAMVSEGAAFIDIGGESTRPGAAEVGENEELDRVCPVLQAVAERFDVAISLDTSTAVVMREGVRLGAHMINDIRALAKQGALQAAAELNVPVCVMHMQGTPQTMQLNPSYTNPVSQVLAFFKERLLAIESAGIAKENLVIDPGFGFGKRLEDNLHLLDSLNEFSVFGLPVLVGLSRKSMLGSLTGRGVGDRLAASLAAASIAIYNGAQIIRVHDVAATVDAVKVVAALRGEHDE